MQEFKNDITYNQVATFKAIFEQGNISKAAKLLNISPASVSFSLKMLEQNIGEPLFNRSTRAIAPTELGKRFYELVHCGVDELKNAVELICDHNKTPSGSLSLNMASDIYDVFLKQIIMDFQLQYPAIQLEITLSDSFDNQVKHNFDIGFRFGETVNEAMIAKRVNNVKNRVKLALFAAPEYLNKVGTPHSIDELQKHALIQFRAPSSQKLFPVRLHKTVSKDSEIISLSQINKAMIVSNSQVMIDSALQGIGIGYLMDASIQKQLVSGELVPILQEHWCDVPNIYLYYAPENKQNRKVTCFLKHISQTAIS